MSEKNNDLVHVSHCCIIHGCSYWDDKECVVAKGKLAQEHLCEFCGYVLNDMDEHLKEIKLVTELKAKLGK